MSIRASQEIHQVLNMRRVGETAGNKTLPSEVQVGVVSVGVFQIALLSPPNVAISMAFSHFRMEGKYAPSEVSILIKISQSSYVGRDLHGALCVSIS